MFRGGGPQVNIRRRGFAPQKSLSRMAAEGLISRLNPEWMALPLQGDLEGDAMNNNLVTVFGGSGFVGRHTVRALARAGWRIKVATRHPAAAFSCARWAPSARSISSNAMSPTPIPSPRR